NITEFGQQKFKKIELLTGGARKIQSGNDILSGGYSFGKFAKDASHIASVVNKAVLDAVKQQAISAATDAALAVVAGKRVRKSKAKKEIENKPRAKLVKGSQAAKDFMAHLRSLRKKK
ncbi:MAG: hypothetical protein WCJ33_09525, partial [Pseudomonadota bacterium]